MDNKLPIHKGLFVVVQETPSLLCHCNHMWRKHNSYFLPGFRQQN